MNRNCENRAHGALLQVAEFQFEVPVGVGRFSKDARAIVSEPLGDLEAAWVPVQEASFLTIYRGKVSYESFAPVSP